MLEPLQGNSPLPPNDTVKPDLFSVPAPARPRRIVVYGALLAIVIVALIILTVSLKSRHDISALPPNVILPEDPYSQNLSLTQLAMSQSTSLSGGTSTFIDGHIRNMGGRTLTDVTMQVLFRNDVGLPPQVERLPLSLIRTHEPYVDTQPVTASPLKPGADVEFRLIFESIPANWNQQMPEIKVVHAIGQ